MHTFNQNNKLDSQNNQGFLGVCKVRRDAAIVLALHSRAGKQVADQRSLLQPTVHTCDEV